MAAVNKKRNYKYEVDLIKKSSIFEDKEKALYYNENDYHKKLKEYFHGN